MLVNFIGIPRDQALSVYNRACYEGRWDTGEKALYRNTMYYRDKRRISYRISREVKGGQEYWRLYVHRRYDMVCCISGRNKQEFWGRIHLNKMKHWHPYLRRLDARKWIREILECF